MKLKYLIIGAMLVMLAAMIPKMTLAEQIPIRGVIEGFYGTPWSQENRIDMLEFCGSHGFNAYIYAPKDDPYHREKWREPYPADKLSDMEILIQTAKDNHVKFIFAISPGLDLNYSDSDCQTMIKKLTAMYELGVRDFAIFFDDIEDKNGIAQANFLNLIEEKFVNSHEDVSPLITVPTEYFYLDMIDNDGLVKSYTKGFAENLKSEILVLYTGNGVVCPGISDDDLNSANDLYNRRLGIWWNYPVTDYMEAKLALGPIENLPRQSEIPAVFFNPMKYEQLSKIALATGADYAGNPKHYEPKTSWDKAIDEQFGHLSSEMKLFADHSQHLENNWANVGHTDGENLREAMDKLFQSDDKSFDDNFNVVKNQLTSLESAVKKLQTELPANILNECRLQLEQFERVIKADFVALDLIKSKRCGNIEQVESLNLVLSEQLEIIRQHENSALISDKTSRHFISRAVRYVRRKNC